MSWCSLLTFEMKRKSRENESKEQKSKKGITLKVVSEEGDSSMNEEQKWRGCKSSSKKSTQSFLHGIIESKGRNLHRHKVRDDDEYKRQVILYVMNVRCLVTSNKNIHG